MEFIFIKNLLNFSIDVYLCFFSLTISFFFMIHFFLEYFKTKTFAFMFTNIFYLFYLLILFTIIFFLCYSSELIYFLKNFLIHFLNFSNIFVYSVERLDHFICIINDYNILIFKNISTYSLDIFWFLNFLFFVLISKSVLFSKNAINSLLFLILTYIYAGILLIAFQLEFFGLLYVIIYVGAIAVLFLFIIMMLKFEKFNKLNLKTNFFFNSFLNLIIFALLVIYFFSIFNNKFLVSYFFFNLKIFPWFFEKQKFVLIPLDDVLLQHFQINYFFDDLNDLGYIFYTEYQYIFLLLSFILLISIVAPIVLTFKERFNVKLQKDEEQLVYNNKKNILFLKN